jgi:HK97 family phage major capsid protein
MSIQALREQRAAKARTLNELVNPERTWNAAVDQPIYDAGMAELDDIDARIARVNALNAKVADDAMRGNVIEASERVAKDKASPGAAVFAKWLRNGERSLNADESAVFYNTMSTTTGSEGGFTVPSDTSTQLIEALKAFGGMREVSTVLVTATGNPLSFPTADATSEIGEIVAENATATVLDTSFGTISVPVYKYSSQSFAVPIELLQDSNIDIEGYINNLMITRLGRITNRHFTTGTGTSQPRGVITGAATGVTAANSTSQVTAVTYASLVDLVHSVDPAYRSTPGVRFMMNDTSVRNIRKIVDGQSRPIFNPGYEMGVPGGAPDMLLGYPVTTNQDMASMAANAKSIAFGDFAKYLVRDAMGVTIRRFDDSAFGLKGQVGFCGWLRSGGNLLDSAAVKVFINAAS